HIEYARNIKRQHVVYRTPTNIPGVLELLKKHNVTVTFFIVGEIAEKFPEVVDMLMDEGHEVAFHGWSHIPLWELNPEAFRQEVIKFKRLHSNCIGFRAPSFSLNNNTKWALEVLKEQNFRYDSSVFPAWTPLYGVYGAPQRPYMPSLSDVSKEGHANYGIIEFPLSVYGFLGFKLPIAGGFWLRFLNVRVIKKGIRKMNENDVPAVFYVHNWELDPGTPKLRLNPYKSFVTYYSIEKTRKLLKCLLSEFHFTSFADYIETSWNGSDLW
ncbi:xylanase, partial [Candidatus Bathyarchaeota archaeon]